MGGGLSGAVLSDHHCTQAAALPPPLLLLPGARRESANASSSVDLLPLMRGSVAPLSTCCRSVRHFERRHRGHDLCAGALPCHVLLYISANHCTRVGRGCCSMLPAAPCSLTRRALRRAGSIGGLPRCTLPRLPLPLTCPGGGGGQPALCAASPRARRSGVHRMLLALQAGSAPNADTTPLPLLLSTRWPMSGRRRWRRRLAPWQ